MYPHIWAYLSSLTKLTQISNNKPKTKNKIIKIQINILDMLELDLSSLRSLK